ncbi:M48 family metallopeptidase [Chitinibacter sp. S2-10]|uniref:M48 family metallopeptidase n=1 Tax=Chitinibacter sp. S2-10 TaxID=3373597 RepID=UPI0039774E4A
MMLVASYLDGHSSALHRVQLQRIDDCLLIVGEGWTREVAIADCELEAALGSLPSRVVFPDGATLECGEQSALAALLGQERNRLALLESRWRYAVAALFAIVLAAIAFYLQGMPLMAQLAARLTPVQLEVMLGQSTLQTLPKLGIELEASQIAPERQQRLRQRFQAYTAGSGFVYQLHFYAMPEIGANAFALPGGMIVVTDGLASLLNDDELMAVLLHEMGHVQLQHGLRNIYQSTGIVLVASVILGDAPGAMGNLAATGAMLVQLGYSRQFEHDADIFAAERLRETGQSPALLADALQKLSASVKDALDVPELLATHPATQERLKALRSAANP